MWIPNSVRFAKLRMGSHIIKSVTFTKIAGALPSLAIVLGAWTTKPSLARVVRGTVPLKHVAAVVLWRFIHHWVPGSAATCRRIHRNSQCLWICSYARQDADLPQLYPAHMQRFQSGCHASEHLLGSLVGDEGQLVIHLLMLLLGSWPNERLMLDARLVVSKKASRVGTELSADKSLLIPMVQSIWEYFVWWKCAALLDPKAQSS